MAIEFKYFLHPEGPEVQAVLVNTLLALPLGLTRFHLSPLSWNEACKYPLNLRVMNIETKYYVVRFVKIENLNEESESEEYFLFIFKNN